MDTPHWGHAQRNPYNSTSGSLTAVWAGPVCNQFENTQMNKQCNGPKVRATLYLPMELLEEARDATVHLAGFPARMTLTKLAETAVRNELQRLKDLYNDGQDFPPRDEDLKGGRPIAA